MKRRLVIGPPGSGKTRTLTNDCEEAIRKYGKKYVRVMSITKAAAQEAASRVSLNPDNVGTVHSACFNALGRKPVATTKKHVDAFNLEYKRNLTQITNQFITESTGPPSNDDRLMADMQARRVRMQDRSEWPDNTYKFFADWQDYKDHTQSWDFVDMIEVALRSLDRAPGGPHAIFFDEAQDASRLEFELLKRWSENTEIITAYGDDLQAIYGWRGGSVDSFLSFTDDIHVLEKSWRLSKPLVEYARKIEAEVRVKYERVFGWTGEKGLVERRGEGTLKNGWWVKRLKEYLEEEETVMIMATTNRMTGQIIRTLRDHDIPYHNPWRKNNGMWNPFAEGTDSRRTPMDRIEAYLNPPWSTKAFKAWADCLNCLKRGALAKMKRMEDVEVMDIDDMEPLFEDGAFARLLSLDLDTWGSMLKKPSATMDFCLNVRKRGSYIDPQVIVGTIHSLKGAEADNVILFPDLSQAALSEWQRDRDTMWRLFYVAVTRARRGLTICGPSTFNSMRLPGC